MLRQKKLKVDIGWELLFLNKRKVNEMTELEKILQPLMEIADDETFCTEEYDTIKDYIEEKEFIGVTTDDWQEITARGYDTGWMIECYVPYLSKEKKLNMAKQIWDELVDVPVEGDDCDFDLFIDVDFRCWNKGSTVIGIWQDIEHWFGVSIATDLMNM